MRKIKNFILILIGVLILTGCGGKNSLSNAETAQKIINSMHELKTYKINSEGNLNLDLDEQKYDMSGNFMSEIDREKGRAKIDINYKYNEKSDVMNALFIIDKLTDEVRVYYKTGKEDDWETEVNTLSEIREIDDSISEVMDNYQQYLDELVTYLFSLKQMKQVSSDKNNYNYEVILTSDDIVNYTIEKINEFSTDSDLIDIDELKKTYEPMLKTIIKGNVTIKISIDKETFCLSKIYIDAKDLVSHVIENINILAKLKLNINFNKVEATISVSDYNKDFNIQEPDNAIEIINNAKASQISDNAYGIRKEAQLLYSIALMENPTTFDKIIVDFNNQFEKNGNVYPTTYFYQNENSIADTDSFEFQLEGMTPTAGVITIYGNGTIVFNGISFNDYICDIPESGEIACTK